MCLLVKEVSDSLIISQSVLPMFSFSIVPPRKEATAHNSGGSLLLGSGITSIRVRVPCRTYYCVSYCVLSVAQ